ncbi:hypothetical protein OV090_31880 [Nannocystis sp. RBIL2]|uniref:hypothetical protein n=1 Tax=Nannocystis sp. RBIL2 TaxID=2996788 RepID=UPI00227073C9|nr:hypothetical protein [Nannocystis sp. RBIL2]MCY1069385.1 hypothetical protein [Nannocystis sp. RBIL2]
MQRIAGDLAGEATRLVENDDAATSTSDLAGEATKPTPPPRRRAAVQRSGDAASP